MANDPDNQELSQADIDAALGGGAEPSDAATPSEDSGESAGALSQADIDAALGGGAEPSDAATPSGDSGESSGALSQADIDAAVAEEKAAAVAAATTAPPPMEDFSPSDAEDTRRRSEIEVLHDVNLDVKIELGRTRMLVEDILHLGDGSVVELDKLAGDPVDVFVNDRLVARGEVLVLNETFCVRISEIVGNVDQQEFASAEAGRA